MSDSRILECEKCERPTSHEVCLTELNPFKTRIDALCGDCGHKLSLEVEAPIIKIRKTMAMGSFILSAHPKGAHRSR